MFFKIHVLENFAMLTGAHLCWSLFLLKLQALKACNYIDQLTTKFSRHVETSQLIFNAIQLTSFYMVVEHWSLMG